MKVVPFVSDWHSNLFKKVYNEPLFCPQMIINSILKSPIKWDNHKCITSHIERVEEQMGLLLYFIGWIYSLSVGHLGPRIFTVNCLVLLASILCRKSKYRTAPALQLGLCTTFFKVRCPLLCWFKAKNLIRLAFFLHLSSAKKNSLSGFHNAVCIFGF